jgi:hypothetical protein
VAIDEADLHMLQRGTCMIPEVSTKVDKAANALCRMRCWDPKRQVSETVKMSYFEYARTEVLKAVQVSAALQESGLTEMVGTLEVL